MVLQNCPRIIIAAPQGRSGKTTVTATLLAALRQRGLAVQPFKKGPDFIDPSWLSRVAGRQCRNLDLYLMTPAAIQSSVAASLEDADIAVVEGAMGLFDGLDLEGSGSTAELAKVLGAPVILVVNTTRMTRSVAAVVLGCQKLDPDLNLAGVVLNNVARPRHRDMLAAAVDRYCGIPVVGVFPKMKEYAVPDRHLGLVPAEEDHRLHRAIEAWSADAEERLDIDRILEIARSAPPMDVPNRVAAARQNNDGPFIGVLRDRSFSFYYPENLEQLALAGARLVFIDSLKDTLPPVDGLYIGGGFPEIFAAELDANAALRQAVRDSVEDGMPVYAECGGLMYLGRSLMWRGKEYCMTGALPFDVDLDEKPRGHGYMLVEVVGQNAFFAQGASIKGHEFHHSRLVNIDFGKVSLAMKVHKGYGIDGLHDGLVYKNTFAAYTHIHALGVPEWAPNFVRQAAEYRLRKGEARK